MAKGASQADLENQIACSEPAALRIGDVMRLLPTVLLRHDSRVQRAYDDRLARVIRSRVQRAYDDRLARVIRYEDADEFTEVAASRSLYEDSVQLNALVRELKLQRYERWLPMMLRWEFQRALEDAPRVEVPSLKGSPGRCAASDQSSDPARWADSAWRASSGTLSVSISAE
jgi:hypothetical protein